MPPNEHPGNGQDSAFAADIDFVALTDSQLCDEIHRLAGREREISFQRRFLHGQLHLARADLARRLTLDQPLALSRSELDEIDRLLDGIDLLDAG